MPERHNAYLDGCPGLRFDGCPDFFLGSCVFGLFTRLMGVQIFLTHLMGVQILLI